MSDIELVIKIPERIHYGIEKGITVNGSKASQILIDAVKNGTPLPKGHGDLVDISYFKHYLRDTYIDSVSFKRATSAMKRLSIIIEADKGESENCNDTD